MIAITGRVGETDCVREAVTFQLTPSRAFVDESLVTVSYELMFSLAAGERDWKREDRGGKAVKEATTDRPVDPDVSVRS